jgi:hypothetical protein
MISQCTGPADTNGGQFKRGHGVLDQIAMRDARSSCASVFATRGFREEWAAIGESG